MPKTNPDPHGTKEPFVPKQDRPEVKISLDTPLNQLRVRELGAILGFLAEKSPIFEGDKTSLKDFFDKDFPEVAKDWMKDIKTEKLEKPEKPEKLEIAKNEKLEKNEKREKIEIKEAKAEKLERDGVFEPGIPPGGDPLLQQVIQAVAGLTRQVSELANQVEALRKKVGG
jgi:hypothetical protein